MCVNYRNQKYGFQKSNTDENVCYVRAKVQEVMEQDVSDSESYKEYELGYQKLMVRVLEGEYKGKELVIDNYITVQHHVVLKENMSVATSWNGENRIYQIYSPTEAEKNPNLKR